MKGEFIVFYGINNLGKTTQAKLLVEKLLDQGRKARYLKYPVYELEPSGQMLNQYLREGNPKNFTPREAQLVYAFNRAQYEPVLRQVLASGVSVVAEDYWGTGVAWGAGRGIDEEFLLELNGNFLREDVAFLFDGERFRSGLEDNHLHETDEELTARVRQAHLKLGQKFGWKLINANGTVHEIAKQIWTQIEKML